MATAGMEPGQAYQSPPTLAQPAMASQIAGSPSGQKTVSVVESTNIDDHLSVQAIIRSYQVKVKKLIFPFSYRRLHYLLAILFFMIIHFYFRSYRTLSLVLECMSSFTVITHPI